MMINSNRKLIIKITVVAFILICLGYYNTQHNGENYRIELRKKSEWNFGGLYVKSLNDSSFYAESNTDSVVGINYRKVIPENEQLRLGDLVKIKSIHLGGDTVDVKFINISRARTAKIWLSIIPVAVIAILFFRFFKFDRKSITFKERNE